MIRCLIFDLDGTLLDTLVDIEDSINYAFNKHGYKVNYSYEEMKQFIGHGARNLILNAGKACNLKEEDIDQVFKTYKTKYNHESTNKTKPFEGVKETLLKLKKKYKLCVLSNKTDEDVQKCINNYFPNIFDFVLGEIKGVKLKPEVDGINLILKKFDLNKDEVIYIGDMQVDEILCNNALIKFVGCKFGYETKKFRKYYLLINSFGELLNYL